MDHSNFKIIELPKENWKGVTIPLVTKSDSFYDLIIDPLDSSGCTISLVRKRRKQKSCIPQRNMIFRILYIRIIGRTRRLGVW